MTVARTADEIKARDVAILEITKLCGFADFFVIATCATRLQMRALAHKIHDLGKEMGRRPFGIEGEHSESWMLLDHGDVIVHLFNPETRRYYDLERLWADAPRVEWSADEAVAPKKG
ncbi:MAG: ribosome silencing factor [Candidatus Sumerlaeota bacterium]|nr:ribosome silencing factor [Candidatus Sumerlaeota bacterium]